MGRPPSEKQRKALAEHAFKPGQSGNPSGRPKSKPLTELLKQILEETTGKGKKRKTNARILVEALLKAGKQGSRAHFQEIADRIEGKVPQSLEVAGAEDAAPILLKVKLVQRTDD